MNVHVSEHVCGVACAGDARGVEGAKGTQRGEEMRGGCSAQIMYEDSCGAAVCGHAYVGVHNTAVSAGTRYATQHAATACSAHARQVLGDGVMWWQSLTSPPAPASSSASGSPPYPTSIPTISSSSDMELCSLGCREQRERAERVCWCACWERACGAVRSRQERGVEREGGRGG